MIEIRYARYRKKKVIDEVVADSASVHLEQLNNGLWMLIIDSGKSHLHLELNAKNPNWTVDAFELERDGEIKEVDDYEDETEEIKGKPNRHTGNK